MNFHRVIGIISFFLLCLIISCTSRHVIRITDSNTTLQMLTLQLKDGSPADTINVKEGDKVLWRIKTNKVKAINLIGDKPDTILHAFVTDHKPHKKFLCKTWVLKVNQVTHMEFKSKGYFDEYYFIIWKPKGADSSKKYDPLIKIYPQSH